MRKLILQKLLEYIQKKEKETKTYNNPIMEVSIKGETILIKRLRFPNISIVLTQTMMLLALRQDEEGVKFLSNTLLSGAKGTNFIDYVFDNYI